MDTFTSYQLITRDIGKSLDRVEAEPTVKRDTEYYLANIGNVKSIKEFLGNDRLFRYAMKAHGLEDMTYAKAFMKKVLTEGIEKNNAFANKLSDKRYYEFARTFDFAGDGELATIFDRAQQGTVDKYMRMTLEQNAGKTNEGVRLALYFQRKAPDITNWYEILADPAMSKVIRTTLGLPDTFASADIDRQVKFFEEKLDITDFSEPKALDKLLKRFTSQWEFANPTSAASTSVSVLFAQPTELGVSTNLLVAMQKLRA